MPVSRPQPGTPVKLLWRDIIPLCDALDQDEQIIIHLISRIADLEKRMARVDEIVAALSNIIVRVNNPSPTWGTLTLGHGYAVLSLN